MNNGPKKGQPMKTFSLHGLPLSVRSEDSVDFPHTYPLFHIFIHSFL